MSAFLSAPFVRIRIRTAFISVNMHSEILSAIAAATTTDKPVKSEMNMMMIVYSYDIVFERSYVVCT